MIKTEDLAAIRRFNDAWAVGDLEAVFACTDPEMEWDWSESMGPFVGVYNGHDGLRGMHADLIEAFEGFRPEFGDPVDCGDDGIVTPTKVSGTARGTGIHLEAHGAMLWVVRSGKIRYAKLFQNVDDALAATGHSA